MLAEYCYWHLFFQEKQKQMKEKSPESQPAARDMGL